MQIGSSVPAGLAFALFCLCVVLYTSTMLPGLGWDDTPEMALAVDCLGIPHSPGFPLFVIVARVIRVLGVDSGAKAGAILAAVSVAGAAALLSWFVTKRHGVLLGFIAGATVGVSPIAWSQACRSEVYGLHLLLATVLILASAGRGTLRQGFSCGYALIMAVVTHPSAVGLAPLSLRFLGSRRKAMAVVMGMALAGTVLLYLPIRSSQAPFLNWGNSSTFEGFVWLISLQEFAADFASGLLIPGESFRNAIMGVKDLLVSALPPLVLGLALVGLPVLMRGWAALPASILAVIVLTSVGGGGPDTAGYLLPLIPMLTLSAVEALSFLRIPKLPTLLVWFVALLLLVVPNLQALDRSSDDSAASYQTALAENTRGRLLFTDNTPDWFFLLEHSYRFQYTPNVVFTPYLHFPWYRASLDSTLMALLSPQRDPPHHLIERAVRDLGGEPVYSFSSLPTGALGRLSPDGWLFRTEPYDKMKDSAELGRWKVVCHYGSPGARHRALRLAQGGQLVMAQGAFPEATDRFTRALLCDPANAAIWTALADAESRMKHDRTALTSAKIALSLKPHDHTIMQACTGIISRLSSGSLGSQATATLCSLSSTNPRSSDLAAKAVRASLLAEQPSHGLDCLRGYTGPETAELTNLEGTALFLQGHLMDAEVRFRKALDMASTEPELQKRIAGNLIFCLQQLGESVEAIRLSKAWRLLHNGTEE